MFTCSGVLLNRRWTRVHAQLWTRTRAKTAKRQLGQAGPCPSVFPSTKKPCECATHPGKLLSRLRKVKR